MWNLFNAYLWKLQSPSEIANIIRQENGSNIIYSCRMHYVNRILRKDLRSLLWT